MSARECTLILVRSVASKKKLSEFSPAAPLLAHRLLFTLIRPSTQKLAPCPLSYALGDIVTDVCVSCVSSGVMLRHSWKPAAELDPCMISPSHSLS